MYLEVSKYWSPWGTTLKGQMPHFSSKLFKMNWWLIFYMKIIVYERLSVMQEQVRLSKFLVHFANNTNSWLAKNTTPFQNEKLATSWDFEFWVPKNNPSAPSPWKVGQTLGSWVFEFWLSKNTPHPKNEKLARSSDFEYPRIPPQTGGVCGD